MAFPCVLHTALFHHFFARHSASARRQGVGILVTDDGEELEGLQDTK